MAPALVLRGFGSSAEFDLTNNDNQVRRIAACATGFGGTCGPAPGNYTGGGSITYVGQAVLGPDPSSTTNPPAEKRAVDLSPSADPSDWTGVRVADNKFIPEKLSDFGAGTGFSITALGGDLLLDPNVSTSDGNITLAAPGGVFNNVGAVDGTTRQSVPGQLIPDPTHHFQVIAKTWEGGRPNGVTGDNPFPNMYGCGAGDCAPTGNAFLYADQPDATVSFGSLTAPFGAPIARTVNYTLTGLVNGDTPTAIFGTQGPNFSLEALGIGSNPAPGVYTVNPTITSPAGYNVQTIPGQVFITLLNPLPPEVLNPPELVEASLPKVCTTTAPALTAYSSTPEGDYLDLDWSRSRQRLSLTSCTGLRLKDSCADF